MVAVTGSGTTELKEKNHVPYIQFKNLSATGIVKHGFSTRKGCSEYACGGYGFV